MSRILIAEDEPGISSFLEKGLQAAGFSTLVVEEAHRVCRSGRRLISHLDLGLPGLTVTRCSEIRRREQCRYHPDRPQRGGGHGGGPRGRCRRLRDQAVQLRGAPARVKVRLRIGTGQLELQVGDVTLDLRTACPDGRPRGRAVGGVQPRRFCSAIRPGTPASRSCPTCGDTTSILPNVVDVYIRYLERSWARPYRDRPRMGYRPAPDTMFDRSHFERLDAADPLAHLRQSFTLPDGVIYFDGNSLGPLPSHVPDVVQRTVVEEWGHDLIRSWNDHGWWDLAERVGERIAPLIGAPPGSVVAGDTTTLALYKAVAAARRLRPDRPVILTDTGNFPTDLYVLGSVAEQAGARVVTVPPDQLVERIGADVAVVSVTHVDYRTGRRHSITDIDVAAREAGALVVWDLSHSAGAMDLDLGESDFAVGCGYKYLNGGPGAPAFLYVHPRHQADFHNPIAGWWGHAEPFADPRALRVKSEKLVADFIGLVDERLPWFEVVTPRSPEDRGSHVSLAHPEAGRIMAALIDRGVVGDVRPPNLLRFGLAPAYQRHVEVWDAVEAVRGVMENDAWRHAPLHTGPVT